MTDDRRNDRIVRSWILGEAPDRAPERVRASIRAAISETPQTPGTPRRPLFEGAGRVTVPLWTAAAVLILALGVAGLGLLGSRGQIGGPPSPIPSPPVPSASPTPSAPSVSPSVAPSVAPTPSGLSLAAGPFSPTAFQPRLRFVLPSGWIKTWDRQNGMGIVPTGADFFIQTDGLVLFNGIYAYARPVAGPPDGGLTPVEGIGTSAKDLAEWLAGRPQLTATVPKAVTLGGRPAWQLDISLSADAGELCGIPCVNVLNSPDRNRSYAFGIEGPWAVHATLVTAPDGSTVLITVEGNGRDRLAAEVAEYQPILDSVSFP
jgi:hypothetical protein